MSRFNKRLAVAAAALALAGNALAGIEDQTPQRTKPTKVESMARVIDRRANSSLRCYQEGRLVFESNDVQPAAKSEIVSVVRAKGGRSIQLFDLKHGICILEHSDG